MSCKIDDGTLTVISSVVWLVSLKMLTTAGPVAPCEVFGVHRNCDNSIVLFSIDPLPATLCLAFNLLTGDLHQSVISTSRREGGAFLTYIASIEFAYTTKERDVSQ